MSQNPGLTGIENSMINAISLKHHSYSMDLVQCDIKLPV